jgi:acyl dehydratase
VSRTHTMAVADLPGFETVVLGPGPWHEVSQQQVNQFADATGDHQWIHDDPERAATGPFGRTIAHGYRFFGPTEPATGGEN